MNMEALVGVIMGILFTILISLILLLMKRNKKSEKVFGKYPREYAFTELYYNWFSDNGCRSRILKRSISFKVAFY